MPRLRPPAVPALAVAAAAGRRSPAPARSPALPAVASSPTPSPKSGAGCASDERCSASLDGLPAGAVDRQRVLLAARRARVDDDLVVLRERPPGAGNGEHAQQQEQSSEHRRQYGAASRATPARVVFCSDHGEGPYGGDRADRAVPCWRSHPFSPGLALVALPGLSAGANAARPRWRRASGDRPRSTASRSFRSTTTSASRSSRCRSPGRRWRRTRPRTARDPAYPAYVWPRRRRLRDPRGPAPRHEGPDHAHRRAARGPTAAGRAEYAPDRPSDFARFARAAARRYPSVRHWMIWGEPSRSNELQAVRRSRRSARRSPPRRSARPQRYARLLDAAYGAAQGRSGARTSSSAATRTSPARSARATGCAR